MQDKLNLISLIGFPRSGTTFIARNLMRHTDISYWEEPKYVWRYRSRPYNYDDMYLVDIEKTSAYINSRLLDYQNKNKTKFLLEKTPSNIFRIDYVKRIVPSAKYLFVFRKPDDVLRSYKIKHDGKVDFNVLIRRFLNRDVPLYDFPVFFKTILGFLYKKYIKGTSEWGIRLRELGYLNTDEKILKAWLLASRNLLVHLNSQDVIMFSYEYYCKNIFECHEKISKKFGISELYNSDLIGAKINFEKSSLFNWEDLEIEPGLKLEAEALYSKLCQNSI